MLFLVLFIVFFNLFIFFKINRNLILTFISYFNEGYLYEAYSKLYDFAYNLYMKKIEVFFKKDDFKQLDENDDFEDSDEDNNEYQFNLDLLEDIKKIKENTMVIYDLDNRDINIEDLNKLNYECDKLKSKLILISSDNILDNIKNMENFDTKNYFTPYDFQYSYLSGYYLANKKRLKKSEITKDEIMNYIIKNNSYKKENILKLKK